MMSETIARDVAVTKSGQAVPRIEKNQAVSFLAPFEVVKHLLADRAAPRRPNRNQPIHVTDPELRGEFDAWEAASDEAFRAMEDDLPE
ncbi:MAG: hypothetical protein ABIK89_13965 [Planctomycetota bacterium]